MKVSGIRATLGVRSGSASLEKFCYDSVPPTGNRLQLHLTIDQSFKDRLAQAKKTTAGQWSPISPTPACPAVTSTSDHSYNWDADDAVCSGILMADLAAVPEDSAHYDTYRNYDYTQLTTATSQSSDSSAVDSVAPLTVITTPADLSDISAVDLLPFSSDWNLHLTDVDVDADFSPLTDIRQPVADVSSHFPSTGTDYIATDQFSFLTAPLSTTPELFPVYEFPVYDDVIGTCAFGAEAPPLDGIDDFLLNMPNIGHAISVQ